MQGLRSFLGVMLFGWLILLASCFDAQQAQELPLLGADTGGTTGTGQGGSGGDLFSSGGGDVGGGPTCDGECKDKPAWFDHLSMFWIGPPENVPPCPDVAPIEGSVGYADLLIEPPTCPSCSCSPAACALPEAMYASAAKCPADGAPALDWNSSPGWEGVCAAEDALPAGLQCSGVPCIQSLTVAAPLIEPCVPSAQGGESIPPPSWGTIARECSLWPFTDEGCGTGQACVPLAPEGFATCVYRFGDEDSFECPAGYDDRRLVVYAGVADARKCEPCACSAQEGADCAALVTAYSDEVCGQIVASVMVAPEQDACVDLLNGTALGSKSATFVVDEPGSCTPTGGAVGSIEPAGPVTLCCGPVGGPAE